MKSNHGRCTREELSAQLHYNGEYLNRIVKKYTGKTILEYGQTIYMEEARELLAGTDLSISAIIEELGFSNRSHFYRLFEKIYGETPLNYKSAVSFFVSLMPLFKILRASVSIKAPSIISPMSFCTFSYFCAISLITSPESSMIVRLSNAPITSCRSSSSSLSRIF
jgi:AraC-like DNA-binding protein